MLRQQERTNWLQTLKNSSIKITNNDWNILNSKYASDRIEDIDLLQLDMKVKQALLRIHVITGWSIPMDDILVVFIDELRSKLLQDYSDMNFDEIIFAFRKYGTVIEDWGKDMNLNLFDKVISAYLNDRYYVSLLEESIKMNTEPIQLEFKPKEYTDEEIISISLDYWQNSPSPKIEFINPNCYEILIKQGKISLDKKNKERILQLSSLMMTGYFTNIIELRKKSSDKEYISMLCKKIAVSEYFNTL